MSDLDDSELVFADPDNGLVDDSPKRRRGKRFGKHIPIDEAVRLASGRTVVIYHHNSRFKGGHDLEVEHWATQLVAHEPGQIRRVLAVRANARSCRTFFVLNTTDPVEAAVRRFCDRWQGHRVRLHEPAV